jgi:hypothetical protein
MTTQVLELIVKEIAIAKTSLFAPRRRNNLEPLVGTSFGIPAAANVGSKITLPPSPQT